VNVVFGSLDSLKRSHISVQHIPDSSLLLEVEHCKTELTVNTSQTDCVSLSTNDCVELINDDSDCSLLATVDTVKESSSEDSLKRQFSAELGNSSSLSKRRRNDNDICLASSVKQDSHLSNEANSSTRNLFETLNMPRISKVVVPQVVSKANSKSVVTRAMLTNKVRQTYTDPGSDLEDDAEDHDDDNPGDNTVLDLDYKVLEPVNNDDARMDLDYEVFEAIDKKLQTKKDVHTNKQNSKSQNNAFSASDAVNVDSCVELVSTSHTLIPSDVNRPHVSGNCD